MTAPQEVQLLAQLKLAVAKRRETDCNALADYLDDVGGALQGQVNSLDRLKTALALLTPDQFPVPLIPFVNGNAGAPILNPGVAPSGFAPEFQDQIPNADQAHHFAAFFQLGFAYGSTIAGAAASWWEQLEGTPGNSGDIMLGQAAALMGAAVGAGLLPVQDVGETVRATLCQK